MLKSLENIGNKARNVGQGISSGISSAVAEIQRDLRIESRKSGGGSYGADFDEAEIYKQMLVSFQVEQAKLGKTVEADLREKQDQAEHWKKLYLEGTKGERAASGEETGAEGEGVAAGALGVDDRIKLQGEVEVLKKVMGDWEQKLQDALEKSIEETALRLRLEHENASLNAKIKELDTARKASEDLILSLSAEKTRMLGSSGEASETIDDLVDEYSRLASEHTAQRQMDAETIQRLENVRDELVEKLKAHEHNILQLLKKGEAEEAMSREMTEQSVVEGESARSQAAGESEEGSRFSGPETGKTWTSEEVQKKLEEQAAEMRAEKESALAELRKILTAEKVEDIRRESESALSIAAEGHAAAMKKAAEAASGAAAIARKEAEEKLYAALTSAQDEREVALKDLSVKKDGENDTALEEAKKSWTKESDAASAELEKRLRKEAEEKLAAAKKVLEGELEAAKVAREETNALYAKENRSRKAIHNRLMELQGNIRVLARVRPMVEVEKESGKNADVTSFLADEDIVVKKAKENTKGKEEMTETRFEFDRVFRPNSTQEGVFEAVSPLVTSVLDGYNVCIFAYGQTGSGKTFTMEGPESNPGVNTRALTSMFKVAEERSSDVKYTFHMSMMEIYNEAVYDLLGMYKDSSKKSLDIRQTPSGGTNVPGVEEVEVSAMADVATQLERGGRNRAVGAHDMNEHSSRSHMILNVRVEGKNNHTKAVVRAKLNLIDLAGSERISKTDATGDRLREAQNINRSLSALGDVIASLAQGKGHVPFRNSKLTFLLQDALSGNSKVLMFVNVSPASYNVTETLCSLNFAARCRNVKLGAASKNQESQEVTKHRRASEMLHAQLVAAGITPSISPAGASPSASPSKSSTSKSGSASSSSASGGRSGTR